MKHSCKQQLLYFIDETLKLQLRTNLDSSFTNICRALSDGFFLNFLFLIF